MIKIRLYCQYFCIPKKCICLALFSLLFSCVMYTLYNNQFWIHVRKRSSFGPLPQGYCKLKRLNLEKTTSSFPSVLFLIVANNKLGKKGFFSCQIVPRELRSWLKDNLAVIARQLFSLTWLKLQLEALFSGRFMLTRSNRGQITDNVWK